MKAAFISDVHIGPSGFFKGIRRKLTEHSEEFITQFIDQVSESSEYSFAIHLGDLIQDDLRESDLENYRKGLKLFSRCSLPVHHVVGNHDTIHMSPQEVGELLGYESLYFSFDVDSVHCVVMYSHVPVPKVPRIVIPAEQLSWLSRDLRASILPTLIFIHHSLADQDLSGNPWFDGHVDDCLVSNRAEVRQVLAESGKVVAVINGHLHWNQVEVHDGIPYITVQSAIENFADRGVPAQSWGEIRVVDGSFGLEVFGNDPFSYEYRYAKVER